MMPKLESTNKKGKLLSETSLFYGLKQKFGNISR